ncbi:Interferon-inducible GTPase 5 [Acipenser ruthenus]|uniref:Interferon-inducible GTPase 5 n=1 Tax=Acipenser ruthenus TaxID=7906 RepID=A0A444UWK7_ACIRT|nr:Interferon-inducible GTPase 5 [Acipenser ruthenus]
MSISLEEVQLLQSRYSSGGLEQVLSDLNRKFRDLDNLTLNIAVAGEPGSGKSSFINAVRGLGFSDKRAALVGVTAKTMQPTAYPHPDLSNVQLWDLPARNPLEMDFFQMYDFFIIVSAERFRESDANLVREIKKIGKQFYFVRTKLDCDLHSLELEGGHFSVEEELEKIRNSCISNLAMVGIHSPQVYLVSSFQLNKYDLEALKNTLRYELPIIKRDALLLSISAIAVDTMKQRITALKRITWLCLAISILIATIPVPLLSLASDFIMISITVQYICKSLGLDRASLLKLSRKLGKPTEVLKAEVKSPIVNYLSAASVIKVLASSALSALIITDSHHLSPIVFPLLGGSLSLCTTYILLKQSLNACVQSAKAVMMKAVGFN